MVTLQKQTLPERAYQTWNTLRRINDCPGTDTDPASDQTFQAEMSTYGDLAQPQTWDRAYASLKAKLLGQAASEDGQFLIEFYLIRAPLSEGWSALVPDVISQMLTIPAAIEALTAGLQEISEYGAAYGATALEIAQIATLLKPLEELSLGTQRPV